MVNNMSTISHKTALVTGGAKRIGKAMCEYLAKNGWNIAVHYLTSEDNANDTVKIIHSIGSKAISIKADLNDTHDTKKLFRIAKESLGPIGLLINNASIFLPEEWDNVTDDTWNKNLNINLKAPFILSQEFAKSLPKKSNGLIINLIDQRVLKLKSDFFSYTLSKSGLYSMTQMLALSLGPRIRVNGIGPGPTLPNSQQTNKMFDLEAELTPLQKNVDPEDIARTMMYLINTESITGQMIAVDCGQHLS